MPVLRLSLAVLLTLPAAALAESDCDDSFIECRDDCSLEFGGSNRIDQKKKFEKCMKKCTKVANRCTEHVMETKAANLDEGALEGTPTSDQVDEHGIPTKTAAKKKKKAAEPVEDDLRNDEPPRKKEELSESEMPKSSRTQLKVEESKKKEEPVKESKAEPAPAKEKSDVIEMKMKPRKEEEDLRDDKPRSSGSSSSASSEEPPPPPKKEKKKEEPAPKKQEEDHDDLRNY